MKLKYFVIISLIFSFLVTACAPEKEENEDMEGLEIVSNEKQINFHFKWKDRELEDGDTYSFIMTETSEDSENIYDVSQTLAVTDGKLGFAVKAEGNTWSISDIYFPDNNNVFRYKEGGPLGELYLNASWKLEPVLDESIIYLDDFVIDNVERKITDVEPLVLYKLTDENTGTTFSYNLLCIYDNKALLKKR